jgi:hypothetical protein
MVQRLLGFVPTSFTGTRSRFTRMHSENHDRSANCSCFQRHVACHGNDLLLLCGSAILEKGKWSSSCTLAVLDIAPPGPENSGSIAETPITYVYLLGTVHIQNVVFDFNPNWFNE